MKKEIIIGASLLILGFVIGVLCRPNHIREVTKKVTDTLVVRDTHIIEKPVLVEQTSKETLLIEVHDTTIVNDTIYVPIPIERKVYKGEDYLAEISGYKANLDLIEVYPKNTIITETITQTVTNRNTLGLGLEMTYTSYPYIPIYLEYSYLLHRNVEVSAKLLYDLPSQEIGFGLGAKFSIGW